jgi:hypothetical protein
MTIASRTSSQSEHSRNFAAVAHSAPQPFLFVPGFHMTHTESNQALAAATGESVNQIRRLGFMLVEPGEAERLWLECDERNQYRIGLFPFRNARGLNSIGL